MKKHSTLASNTFSFNGCLRLACLHSVLIYSVYHHNNENPQGVLLYICLVGIDLK